MSAPGISLLYAPPFSIVSRFFLTSAVFGVVGSLIGIYQAVTGEFRFQALVHTFTLGFAGMTMVGALFQMLPVVAGAVIENPLRKATFVHATLTAGTALLVAGLWDFKKTLLIAGILLVGMSLLFILPLMLYKLLRLKSYTNTSSGMRYALLSATAGTVLGILAVLSVVGILWSEHYNFLREAHMSLMLFGWVGILIASVAFQVIEMFFVTPPYPEKFARALPPLILLLAFVGLFFEEWFFKIPLSAVLIVFAFLTLDRLRKRRRKIPDPLVSLWYLGMVLLIMSMTLYPFADFGTRSFTGFLLLYGGFVHSIILAMMYRIIPFLVWLHLSNRGVPNAPTMHEVISPKKAWWQFYLHIACISAFAVAFLTENKMVSILTGFGYSLSFLFLLLNLSGGVFTYVRIAYRSDDAPQR